MNSFESPDTGVCTVCQIQQHASVAPPALHVSGRAYALALTQHRHVVGFGLLERGRLDQAHTGTMSLVMVESSRRGAGHGTELVHGLLEIAAGVGIERVRVLVPAAAGLERFLDRFGFVECGRLPGWFRTDAGVDDGALLAADVPASQPAG